MAQISTVQIPCWVVQENNEQFLNGDEITGKQIQVPCRNVLLDEWWAVPVKDAGIFTVLEFIPTEDNYQVPVTQPTYDSFRVVRARDKFSGYAWWIYGTEDDFVTSCSTCCDETPTPMPGDDVFPILIAPCQDFCEITNDDGDFQAIFGLPSLSAGKVYFPYGSYNNVALTTASTSGYANVAALLSFLNTNWTNLGSPSQTITWTATADNLTLIATGGNDGDSICVSVIAITPSP